MFVAPRVLTKPVVASVAAVVALTAPAIAGPDWTEIGDAGSGLGSAQAPVGAPGSGLNSISGTLSSGVVIPDFEDCYIIRILNPAIFSVQITSADFNAQLFLFNITVSNQAYGLLANDDRTAGDNRPLVQSPSTDGTGVIIPSVGDYMLAVTGFNRDPQSLTGAIFNQATTTEISGADGVGGLNPHTGWAGTGQTGSYLITLIGAGIPNLPAPGAAGLLAATAGLLAGRRRR